jgi:hypothetical protein
MNATDVRVWTREELLDPTIRRPRLRRGDSVRIAARFTPKADDPERARYELISPCCGKRTFVERGFVRRMLSGQWTNQYFECGKPWTCPRGNPRNGGCRARYTVTPALVKDGHPAAFDLTWDGL